MSYIALLEQTPSVNLGMAYTALHEQTPGVPQATQASRLLCIYLLFVTQAMIVSMVMMIQVLHLLLVNEAFENKGQYADRLYLCGHCGEDIGKAVYCNFGSGVL